MVRFLHTGDWQLGMPRHFLEGEAQARFTQARFDAVVRIGQIVVEEKCEFVVVAGDVFDMNQPERRTVVRALEAMAQIPVPVFLLPGNHDPLDAATVFRSAIFQTHCPPNVRVIVDSSSMHVRDGVEVVGAPWTSKRPLHDLVTRSFSKLPPAAGVVRIGVGHGAVDTLSPNVDNPAAIELAAVESLLKEGRIHYLALGDRHSLTSCGSTGRVWYAGAPEPTDFDEVDPGHVLVVDVSPDACTTRSIDTWTWKFVAHEARFAGSSDVDALSAFIQALPEKTKTVLNLACVGTLNVRDSAALADLIEHQRDLLAAIDVSERRSDLVVLSSDADFQDLGFSGFAADAVAELRNISAELPSASGAQDALGLLVRLARRHS